MTNLTPANLFSLPGKVALVTGGGRGIGAMIAEGLLGAGARVIISSRRQEQLDEAVEALSAIGPVEAIAADCSTEQGCLGLAEAVGERTDRLDILVNNAGATWGAPMREFPDSAWDKVLNLNVKGVFQLTVALLPLLEAAATPDDPARVINLGSIQGLQAPDIENYSYSASKAAVHHLTRVLAKKLGPQAHHGERHRTGGVLHQDDGPHPGQFRRRDRRGHRPWATGPARGKWPAQPYSSRDGAAPI